MASDEYQTISSIELEGIEAKIEAQAKMITDIASDLSVLMVCGSCDHCVATSYDMPFCYLENDKYVALQDTCAKWYSARLNENRNRCLTSGVADGQEDRS